MTDTVQQGIDKLNDLHSKGLITDAELEAKKSALLDSFLGLAAAPAAGRPAGGRGFGRGGFRGFGRGGFGAFGGFGGYGGGFGGYGGGFGGFGGGFGGYGGFGGFGGRGFGRGFSRFHPYGRGAHLQSTTVKIQPVPAGITEEELNAIFSAHGEIETVALKDGNPNYAYVNFKGAESAAAAAAVLSMNINGEICRVSLGKPKLTEPSGPTTSVGLFNIPFTTTQDELEEMMSGYPGIQAVRMVSQPTGEFRGFAFADFDTVENAKTAKDALTGLNLGGMTVDVKFAYKPAPKQ